MDGVIVVALSSSLALCWTRRIVQTETRTQNSDTDRYYTNSETDFTLIQFQNRTYNSETDMDMELFFANMAVVLFLILSMNLF